MGDTLKIAFYGKGGIGKSTIASNVSALLAIAGRRVLHIGCDPKADSTRLLTERRIPTVLEQLEAKDKLCREDMVFPGFASVCCVEAGGPEAGQGCAGLGITTAINELTDAGVFHENWDAIVYDVLGDVVCGGFSVPMRQHYADRVYVVTSAAYMSLYAANNILKGVRRYSMMGSSLLGGIILNHVHGEMDLRLGHAFAETTGTSILAALTEDERMQAADYRRGLFVRDFPDSENARRLRELIAHMEAPAEQPLPEPMAQQEMEAFGQQMAEVLYGKR